MDIQTRIDIKDTKMPIKDFIPALIKEYKNTSKKDKKSKVFFLEFINKFIESIN